MKMGIMDVEAVARRLQALKDLIRAYVESCWEPIIPIAWEYREYLVELW